MSNDLFSQIPIKRDFDQLIAEVKQLLQHAICIDHKKILSDDTCRIFAISTPQEAIATFAANSIPSELLYPAIISLAEAEYYYSQVGYQDQDQDQSDEQVEEEEEDIVDLMIQHEINEHRINDGPDPTFDGTYEIGSDDPPEDDDESEDGYVDEYEGDSDEDEEVEDEEDDYSQEEDE